jgi:DNA polymerase-3 subunit delta'
MLWQTIGFDKIKGLFNKTLNENTFGHAYIFTGEDMIGKKTFALELAGIATGPQPSKFNPDVLFIDTANSESGQSITIDGIRQVKNFVSLSAYSGNRKFIIIDEAQLMTDEAQNASLKILEEPNPSSIMILVTSNPGLLLPTVVSRCQEIRFPMHRPAVVREILESASLTKTQIEFLAEFCGGRLGLAKRIIAGDSFENVKKSVEELMHLIKSDLNERLAVAQKMTDEKNKAELADKILYWTLYLRTRIDEPKSHKILNGLLSLHRTLNQPQFNQRLALENFLVQF